MKYIKTFNDKYTQRLSKKTVNYNKIYSFSDRDYNTIYVGKISTNPGDGFRDVGCILDGYNFITEEPIVHLVKYSTWRWIREATQDEIDFFETVQNIKKYNL